MVSWRTGSDLLVLFTDGLSDTLAAGARGSGEDAVLEVVVNGRRDKPSDLVDRLFRKAEAADPSIPADDITALVLRV